jgi:ABC-type sugar transport system ATPase subunit
MTSDSTAQTAAPALLEASGLARSFGATKALVDGSVSVGPGQIVALMGENGSGKSTMVKLLSGILRPDAGEIRLGAERVTLHSPRAALRAGIVTVFQEILVAPDLSVLENLWLGNGSPVSGRRARAQRRRRAAEVLGALCPQPPDLDAPVGTLDLMHRQVCAIARGLLRDPRVLILDEATSTLDVTLRDRLFAHIRTLCRSGVGVLFISHRMDEVLSLADRCVALRAGTTVGSVPRSGATAEELVRMVSGQNAGAERTRVRSGGPSSGQPALRISGLRVREDSAPLDLEVGRGEIIGLAGLEGHGQDEFLRVLAGLRAPAAGTASVLSSRKRAAATGYAEIRGYRQAVRQGIAYVPRDRKAEGIADVLSCLDNFSVPTLREDARLGMLSPRRTRGRFETHGRGVNLEPAPGAAVGRLSGGNQQKVILARWLATRPAVLLLNDPTRGVDLKTKHELYDVFERLASEGMTFVMLSTELEEHLSLMDRILVFHGGSCTRELTHADATREALVSAYFGHGEGAALGGERR